MTVWSGWFMKPVAALDRQVRAEVMFWSKSRLSLRWPEIILSLLLYHGRYWTSKLGTSDSKSWTYHKHGVWSNSHKDNLIQKHFLTIRCGSDWAGLNFTVSLLLLRFWPTFLVSLGFPDSIYMRENILNQKRNVTLVQDSWEQSRKRKSWK